MNTMCLSAGPVPIAWAVRRLSSGSLLRRVLVLGQMGLLLAALFFPPLAQAELEFRPVDEASLDPSFLAFRNELLQAVARRDAKFVLSITYPNIKYSFADLKEGGLKGFNDAWDIQNPRSSFWQEFEVLLKLGGGFSGDYFWAPYVFSRWPTNLDSFLNVAVVERGAKVRAQASSDAPVLASLSYVIVPVIRDNQDERRWLLVRLEDGAAGYVEKRYTRSPLELRASFKKTNGRWQLHTFIAGD